MLILTTSQAEVFCFMKDLKGFLRDFKGRKVLMAVYPHPDDESVDAGGILLAAKRFGFKTVVVTLTKGGAGQVRSYINGSTLKVAREKELRKAAGFLKVDKLIIADFQDGKLRQTVRSWGNWLSGIIKEINPGILVTYDPSGVTGHPDHIALTLELKRLFQNEEKSERRVILWVTLWGVVKKLHIEEKVKDVAVKPDFELDLGTEFIWKWLAIRSHKSQKLDQDFECPIFWFVLINHKEWYHQVDLKKNYPFRYIEFKI